MSHAHTLTRVRAGHHLPSIFSFLSCALLICHVGSPVWNHTHSYQQIILQRSHFARQSISILAHDVGCLFPVPMVSEHLLHQHVSHAGGRLLAGHSKEIAIKFEPALSQQVGQHELVAACSLAILADARLVGLFPKCLHIANISHHGVQMGRLQSQIVLGDKDKPRLAVQLILLELLVVAVQQQVFLCVISHGLRVQADNLQKKRESGVRIYGTVWIAIRGH